MKTLLKASGFLILLISLSFAPINKKTVVIDVGHGGHDHGNLTNNVKEKDVVLNIALKIKDLAQDSNIDIVLTRESDEFLSLKDRVEFINAQKPVYTISLHTNGNEDKKTRGFEVFINKNTSQATTSVALAELFSNELAEALPNRGIKQASFYILKHVTTPAIILELGFLTNSKDSKYLNSENGQNDIAEAIFKSIQE